ncbi:4Fe-4S single cluster domain-containing protein [Actinoallomurus rhizosphaericola]|uniref:4Fe-4S single cluster domain-containing protein n=1 Tax=Actinoallomurus rhizosphaericola TaxID=2952536 RepID=UPI002093EB17|nr:4Fe-4S single cluster domain-containing protein [Actinoallomurus rhizosphaericola]MCO5998481.1 radical SAM protein [Actinoallomurus rhizosphaericola]
MTAGEDGGQERTLLLAKAHFPVTTLGPGRRAGIWTQGCTIHCPGCVSRDTWEADPRTAIPVSAVLGWLRSLTGVDGVTISGGEPFQQPEALRALLLGIRAWAPPEVDVLVYSGYAASRLRRSARTRELLELCDAVVTGPYIERLNQVDRGLRWRGSSNQQLITVSDLGRKRYGDAERGEEPPHMQVSVEDNRIYYIGIPRRGDMERLTQRLSLSGVHAGEVSWRP